MSSSREEECAPSYPFFAHAWPYTDSKDLNAHHSVPVESYYLQDYGIFSMDGFTSEDLLSPANVTDYSPATPGSETFFFTGAGMGLHPSTLHGPDAVIFPSSSTGNLTFFNPAPHVNPSIAAQATSPLTPASSAETTATQTNSPSSLFNPSKKPTRSTVAHKKPRHAPHPRPSTVVTNVTTIVNPGPDTEPQLKNPPKKKKKQQQKQENNVDDAVLRKKAHNLVEKRYRANLNSRFAALEQAVRSKTATTVVTAASTRNTTTSTSTSTSPTGTTNLIVKSTSDTRTNGPSKKAAILKNALAYIEELRSENRTLRKELALLRRTTTYGTITGIGSSPEYTEEG